LPKKKETNQKLLGKVWSKFYTYFNEKYVRYNNSTTTTTLLDTYYMYVKMKLQI
jgi:hypothetical protein